MRQDRLGARPRDARETMGDLPPASCQLAHKAKSESRPEKILGTKSSIPCTVADCIRYAHMDELRAEHVSVPSERVIDIGLCSTVMDGDGRGKRLRPLAPIRPAGWPDASVTSTLTAPFALCGHNAEA